MTTPIEKLQYDSTSGGHVILPDHIQTFQYAAARVQEIKELLKSIKEPASNNKLVFQSLPKHMRRRAMSHHPKRLPVRYRAAHQSQMLKSGKPQQMKRPSRKYRRKPCNLLKEYVRRGRKNVWLETHIWHAKRFHMIPKWGYKLPYESCDKTYRACYRATTKHCLLQDISYYGCIELQGDLKTIREGFTHLTSPKCGLSITAKAFVSGRREGFLHLFKSDQYPYGALTKINYFWKPPENLMQIRRTVWVFIHPSAYREVLDEIIKVFQLKSVRQISIPIQDDDDDDGKQESRDIITKMQIDDESPSINVPSTSKNIAQVSKSSSSTSKELHLKFMTKTFAYLRNPRYENNQNGIILIELKDTINRFRLTGPLSQAILYQALKSKPIRDDEPDNWYKEYLQDDKYRQYHNEQIDFWENCESISSPGQLSPFLILNLNVEDPRINQPTKRSKALPIKEDNSDDRDDDDDDDGDNDDDLIISKNYIYNLSNNLSRSPLWDFDLRNKLIETMMPTHSLCLMRQKHSIVPGERCSFENDLQPIPVLLIQRPGSLNGSYKRLNYGCGWDIIIPSGYGMAFWLSFIMWGARPGGIRELNTVNREHGQELHLPDTISGRKDAFEKYTALKNKYFRLPPNKRCNYKKLSIYSPFKIPFQQLAKEWSSNGNTENFFILRERESLECLVLAINRNLELPSMVSLSSNCLIQIYLKMKNRGNPGDFSIICLPKQRDIKRYWKSKRMNCNQPIFTEPLKIDDTERERKVLRLQHKKLLKKLRNKRVREKRKLQEKSDRKVRIRPANTSKLVLEQFQKMSQLWLPSENGNSHTIRYQCKREVFGYVTQSDFSFTEATVTAIGYITVNGLKELLRICGKGEKIVLIRGTKSRHYRFANFKINTEL